MATLPPGSRLDPFHYEVVWALDANRPVQVYLAKITGDAPGQASYVVVKLAHEPAALAHEVDQLCRLKHPGIVRIFPLQTAAPEQHPYLAQATHLADQPWFSVREYLAGGSLSELMRESELDLGLALEIGREVATTLDYIHSRQQVHLSINPCHVLLRARPVPGKPVQPVLIGFGHSARPPHQPKPSLAYSAPEARALPLAETSASARLQPATDIYSLGVLLYEMLTGHLPQPDKTGRSVPRCPSSYDQQISPRLDALLLQMISQRSQERPSAAEVATRLETIAVQEGYLHLYPSGTNDTVQSLFARRHNGPRRLRLGVIALSVLAVLQFLLLLWVYLRWY